MNPDGRDSDDADWLLAQLATGGSPAGEETPVTASPSGVPRSDVPSVAAPSEAAAPLPRSEEVLDWFTMAESSTAQSPGSPEGRPAFTAGGPPAPAPAAPAGPAAVGGLPAPAAAAPAGPAAVGGPPAPAGPIVPPGPATPSAPFAFSWGSDEVDSEDAIRAAFRSLSGGQSAHDEAPTDTGPALARQSFTPVTGATPVIPRHPIAPTTAPAGWDDRPAPTPKADFDDELWSALTDDEPAVPAATIAASVAESAANRRAPFPAFAAARGGDPFGQPDDRETKPVDDLLAALGSGAARPSGEGSGSGTSVPGDREAGFGTPPAGGTPPSGSGGGASGWGSGGGGSDDDGSDDDFAGGDFAGGDDRGDDGSGDGPGDDGPGDGRVSDELGTLGLEFADEEDVPAQAPETESPIAREVAEAGYFWNLTPDPTAPDPKADPSVAAGATTVPSPFGPPSAFADDRDEAAPFELEPEPEPEPEPVVPEPAWPLAPVTTAYEPPATTEVAPPETTMFEPPATSMFKPPDTSAFEPAAPTAFEPPQTDFDQAPPTAAEPVAHGTTDTAHTDPFTGLFGTTAEAGAPSPSHAPSAPTGASFPTDGAFTGAAAVGGSTPAARAAAPAASSATAAPRARRTSGSGRAPSAGSSGGSRPGGDRTTRTLLWIAAGLVVCLVLAGLFYVGTLLSAGGGEAVGPSAPPVETETPVAEPTAPQPVGVHAWNTLFGGECVEPFVSVWEQEFTVVDCAAPHAAELVFRGELAGDAAAAFPGEAEVATQATAMCTADGVIDVGLVAGIPDLQVQAAFPADEQQWADGERTVYCFANRIGAEPLTGSIAGPGPTA